MCCDAHPTISFFQENVKNGLSFVWLLPGLNEGTVRIRSLVTTTTTMTMTTMVMHQWRHSPHRVQGCLVVFLLMCTAALLFRYMTLTLTRVVYRNAIILTFALLYPCNHTLSYVLRSMMPYWLVGWFYSSFPAPSFSTATTTSSPTEETMIPEGGRVTTKTLSMMTEGTTR